MTLKNSAYTKMDNKVFEELLVDKILTDFNDHLFQRGLSKLFHYVVAKIDMAGIDSSLEDVLQELEELIIQTG